MTPLIAGQITTLRARFLPERPGPLIGSHLIQTGHSPCLVDRWPEPNVVLVETAGNYALLGQAQALPPEDFPAQFKGFVETAGGRFCLAHLNDWGGPS